jgi:hypothetical protein
MIEICTECGQDFLTEADPYGIWHRLHKTHMTCSKCFIKLIEPMGLERINQLEDSLKDMGEALVKFEQIRRLDGNGNEFEGYECLLARKTLQKHSELLSKIYEEKSHGDTWWRYNKVYRLFDRCSGNNLFISIGEEGVKYIKKPVIIEAIQWLGSLPLPEEFSKMGFMEHENGYDLEIDTLEGVMICRMNDYIIKGVKGEFYPCKPDIFEMTYEVVNEHSWKAIPINLHDLQGEEGMRIKFKSVKETLDQRITEALKHGKIIDRIFLTEDEALSLQRECYPYSYPSDDKKFFYMGYTIEVEQWTLLKSYTY